MKTNYNDLLYAFILNSEYHLITRISNSKYGVVPLFTHSYGIETVEDETLNGCLEKCRANNWNITEFSTYSDLFAWALSNEDNHISLDTFGVYPLTNRVGYVEKHGNTILKFHENNSYTTLFTPPTFYND